MSGKASKHPRVPVLDKNGIISKEWSLWLTNKIALPLAKNSTAIAGLPDPSAPLTGQAGDFVTLDASGNMQDAGANPDLTTLQHDHSVANKGGFISPLALNGLNAQSNAITVDVALTSANTYYDGPSITLPAGAWLLLGSVYVSGIGADYATSKLWDGASNILATSEISGGARMSMFLAGVTPTLSASTTYKISAALTSTGATMRAALTDNPAGNTASYITAIQIG